LPSRADWQDRRCLVTGASGFIGAALCRDLVSAGAHVWGLGRRQHGPTGVRWLSCDVTDRQRVEEALHVSRPDAVFHLASLVTGVRRVDVVLPTLHGNLMGFVNVALAAADVQCRKIVCMGSLQEPDQSLPAIPSSPYAAAKYAASCYARMLAEVFKLPIVIARPLMVYGPGQLDLTKLVPHVLSSLLAGKKAPLSTGAHLFDWVYIDDVCDALLVMASSQGVIGRTVDVGTGVLTSAIDVARGLAQRVGAVDELQIGAIPDRIGEPTRAADTATTRSLIGWQARFTLEEGLDLTVRWFKACAADEFARRGMC